MKSILASLILLIGASAAAQTSPAIAADSLYNNEEFRGATEMYARSIAEEGPSAETYYNLGNAYYRTGQAGRAVVAYERALKLNPTHEDARTNLAFVNSRIEDRPEDDSAFLSNLQRSISDSMTANAWAWTALTLFALLLGAAALYIFASGIGTRKCGFFGGILLCVLFVYSLATAIGSASRARSHSEAVVIVPTTYLSSTPRPSSTSTEKLVAIHEGTKVEIIDSLSTPDDPTSPKWYNVKINNSTKAWLKAIDVEKI
ncbi:MAG: tetratricopeptide repeat protein [Muribaculaceae bacterium]|nr:tetratricopeptide repeat protein [Muribaculaceae bacterium]